MHVFFNLNLIHYRWTRREEADFYRVVSTFGVVFDPDRGQFDWTKFRALARLHKKTDNSLEKYLCAFMSMCRRVCRLPSKEGMCKVSPVEIKETIIIHLRNSNFLEL